MLNLEYLVRTLDNEIEDWKNYLLEEIQSENFNKTEELNELYERITLLIRKFKIGIPSTANVKLNINDKKVSFLVNHAIAVERDAKVIIRDEGDIITAVFPREMLESIKDKRKNDIQIYDF